VCIDHPDSAVVLRKGCGLDYGEINVTANFVRSRERLMEEDLDL